MVPGLRNFITRKIPEAREIIAIEQKIDEWKSAHPDATPIIVFDFAGFYRLMCNGFQAQLDVLFCKHKRSLDTTESMLKRLQSKGVQLEFFCGGPSRSTNKSALINGRRQQFYNNADSIFKMIKDKWSPKEIIHNLTDYIYNNASYFVAAIMLAKKYGRIHKSYYNECERDIAAYASRYNAIAVISGDSDFILINGEWSFWDILQFDSAKFEIEQFDKKKVRDFLQLNEDEMPLVGVFTGNNLPYDLVKRFLNKLIFKDITNSFTNVAEFIIKEFRDKSIIPNCKQIANLLSLSHIEGITKTIQELLEMFANRTEPEPVDECELLTVAKGIQNSYVYEFLKDLRIPVQPSFLHETKYDTFMAAALEIFKRQMGIVLKHLQPSEQRREVISFKKKASNYKTVCPIYPNIEVPSLLRLYEKAGNNNTLLETKLKLLCWITSEQLDYTTIEQIPKHYLCAVLSLVNMVENLFIAREEADCILYCLQQSNLDSESMNLLSHPDTIAERPFELSFLYDKFYQFMAISMNTVGLSDLLVHNELDGIYFHQQYEEFVKKSAPVRDILLEKVSDYRIY